MFLKKINILKIKNDVIFFNIFIFFLIAKKNMSQKPRRIITEINSSLDGKYWESPLKHEITKEKCYKCDIIDEFKNLNYCYECKKSFCDRCWSLRWTDWALTNFVCDDCAVKHYWKVAGKY